MKRRAKRRSRASLGGRVVAALDEKQDHAAALHHYGMAW